MCPSCAGEVYAAKLRALSVVDACSGSTLAANPKECTSSCGSTCADFPAGSG